MSSQVKKLGKVFPATHIVHWPSGPVYACGRHAEDLINLGKVLGYHVVATVAEPGKECTNCSNEQGGDSDE